MGASDGDPVLNEHELASSWLEQFEYWHQQVRDADVPEPEAMLLASADAEGRPSARSVLLKGLDERGFVFFTNLESRKGRELTANHHAALVFPWWAIHRQVLITGTVALVEPQEADEYFASRPYGSRISARASRQSRVIPSREALEAEWVVEERRYPPEGEVPRPQDWSGFRLAPSSVEFWQGRRDRLHDRLRFRLGTDGDWLLERLSP
jgi:pyridoxamine 5'-phosphate oxidase